MMRAKSFLVSQIARETRSLKNSVATIRADGSANAVHDFRVLTRRLRAPIWLVQHAHDTKRARKAQSDLRKLGRALGERRKWDVGLEDARNYGAPLKKFKSHRKAAQSRLRAALKPRRTRRLLKNLSGFSTEVKEISPEMLAIPLYVLELKLIPFLKRPPRTKMRRHQLRVQMKKIRYVLESLGHHSRSVEALQDHLGREHDLDILQQISGRCRLIQRDETKERARAEKFLMRALRSALHELKSLQKELSSGAMH